MAEREPGRDLLHLVEAIADGADIDWKGVETRKVLDEEGVRSFELIDSVFRDYERAADEVRTRLRAPLLAPDSRWGSLRVLEPIGAGTFGQVFRAFDRSLERDVALKILRDSPRRGFGVPEFLAEARRLARVHHPNVLTVHGVAVHEGRAGIWTELVLGRTLEEILVSDGPLPPEEVERIGITLCAALSAVHAAGLIHRDVKTQNVMRAEDGRIVLTDFGAMDHRFDQEGASSSAYGSLRSMAPELIRGGAASPSTDVYALGVLLYRLLSQRYPVPLDPPAAIVSSRPLEAVPLSEAAPGVPAALAAVIDRALAVDPERRFAGPNAMAAALGAALEPSQPPKAPAAESYRPPRGRDYSMLAAIAASAVISALVVVGVTGFGIPWLARHYQGQVEPVPKPPPPPPERVETAHVTPTPALPAGLRAAPVLFRVDELGRERLADRARIHGGDQLVLEVETGAQPVTCFVLDEDGAGIDYVLFPLPGYRLGNPLKPSARHRLPDGSGSKSAPARTWAVDSENGRENVVLITSVEPLPWLESLLRDVPRPSETPPEPLASTSVGEVRRGIGRIAPAPVTGRLALILDRLRESKEYRSGRAGFWRISLRTEPQVAY